MTQALAGADRVLVGVGTVVPDLSSLVRAGYFALDGAVVLRELRAVGDVCARYDDQAGGAVKAESLLEAPRGGLVDVLVTDRAAAERLLAGADANAAEPAGTAKQRPE